MVIPIPLYGSYYPIIVFFWFLLSHFWDDIPIPFLIWSSGMPLRSNGFISFITQKKIPGVSLGRDQHGSSPGPSIMFFPAHHITMVLLQDGITLLKPHHMKKHVKWYHHDWQWWWFLITFGSSHIDDSDIAVLIVAIEQKTSATTRNTDAWFIAKTSWQQSHLPIFDTLGKGPKLFEGDREMGKKREREIMNKSGS